MRIVLACAVLAISCEAAPPPPDAPAEFDPASYRAALADLDSTRAKLAAQLRSARTADEKARIRREARAAILEGLDNLIFPAWMGTPWSMGRNSTASMPHEPGKTVGCSYFVTGALMNAGLRFDSRSRFAQAPALHIQRSLAPDRSQLNRYLSIPAAELAADIENYRDGLYIIGLRNHIGFIRVRDGTATFIHSGPGEASRPSVQAEPLATAPSVVSSRPSGYFVTPVFADGDPQSDALVDHWLTREPVKFQRLGAR